MRVRKPISQLTTEQLDRRLQRLDAGVERVDALIELANRVAVTDTPRSINLLNEAVDLSRTIQNKKGELASSLRLASLYDTFAANYVLSREFSTSSEKLALELGDERSLAIALRCQGSVFSSMGEYDRAQALLEECLQIQTRIEDHESIPFTHTDLGYLHWMRASYLEAQQYFETALAAFTERNNKQMVAGTIHNLGVLQSELGHYSEAIAHLEKSISIKQEIDDTSGLSISYSTLATQYLHIQDYENALFYYQKSFDLRSLLGLPMSHSSLSNLGYTYSKLQQPELAIEYYRKALDSATEGGDTRNAIDYKLYLASAYLTKGDVETSDALLEQIEQSESTILDPVTRNTLRQAQALAYKRKGQIEKAIEHMSATVALSEVIANSFLRIRSLVALAELHAECQQNKEAIDLGLLALGLIRHDKERSFLQDVLRLLHSAYSESGDYKSAYEFMKQLSEAQIEFHNTSAAHKVKTLMVQFDTEQSKREALIHKLKAENLELELEMKKNELTALALHLINKNEFLIDIRESIGTNISDTNSVLKTIADRINSTVGTDADWVRFEQQFLSVNPEFSKKLMEASLGSLTQAELKVCQLLRTGLSTKEISNILFVSKRTIDTHRHNIHKKLGIKDVNLTSWIMAL